MFTIRIAIVAAAVTVVLAAVARAAWAETRGGNGDGNGDYAGGQSWGYYVGAAHSASSEPAAAGAAPAGPQAANTTTAPPGCRFQLTYCAAAGINAGAVAAGAPGSAPNGNSPAALALRAWRTIYLPLPDVTTAPPRGSDGWVGIPEFFWLAPDQWTTRTVRAQAGPEWAQVQAAPARLRITLGRDLTAVTCDGPGVPYRKATSPADLRACTYLYQASSLNQPTVSDTKHAYAVTATVTWTGRWRGAGGTGGTLPPVTRTTTFPLRVGEAQALVQRG